MPEDVTVIDGTETLATPANQVNYLSLHDFISRVEQIVQSHFRKKHIQDLDESTTAQSIRSAAQSLIDPRSFGVTDITLRHCVMLYASLLDTERTMGQQSPDRTGLRAHKVTVEVVKLAIKEIFDVPEALFAPIEAEALYQNVTNETIVHAAKEAGVVKRLLATPPKAPPTNPGSSRRPIAFKPKEAKPKVEEPSKKGRIHETRKTAKEARTAYDNAWQRFDATCEAAELPHGRMLMWDLGPSKTTPFLRLSDERMTEKANGAIQQATSQTGRSSELTQAVRNIRDTHRALNKAKEREASLQATK